jgi:hypothetical protein
MIRLKSWPPPAPKEEEIHRAVVKLLESAARHAVVWTHMPAGEARNRAVAGKLLGLGTKRGWPDLLFVLPPDGRLCGLELKRPDGRLSEAQKTTHAQLAAAGALVEVAYGFDEAVAVLRRWGVLRADKIRAS